ncbi:hypothetical protein [Thauera chlorobenzoica]|uniref:Uncharacterized protein n=1 Tax=Thauera chlorobenzoica TaxID=96773 RepID=A0A1H5T2W8_9RHOO|nr:hypothetical protein [Thauera chlorobenzoica]APR04155.1 hypothetical protein Tchl_1296 [Thauera chlorobenzoica]SEF57140.1 hypothetical protein SAMN05216242_102185 [Thauera chlorobenzoica]
MSLKKRFVAVPWLSVALTAPLSPAQGLVVGGVASSITGEAQEDDGVPAAEAIRGAEAQCRSAGTTHWALYQCLRDRSTPVSPPRPNFSGNWFLNTTISDDPHEKAKEATQASRHPMDRGRGMPDGSGRMGQGGVGMGAGRQGRMDGEGGSSDLSSGELSLLTPAQELHVTHQDPMLLIADESDRRQRLFTNFYGANVSASGGFEQRIAVAGWEGAELVVETTTFGRKLIQNYQIDHGTGQLVISCAAKISDGQTISYRLVYDRLKPSPSEQQVSLTASPGHGGNR